LKLCYGEKTDKENQISLSREGVREMVSHKEHVLCSFLECI